MKRLCLLLAVVVLAVVGTAAVVHYVNDDSRRDYLSASGWPTIGQAAYSVSGESVLASPRQSQAPIASLAKVMTAYLVLQHYPDAAGLWLRVDADDVADTARRADRDESVVAVRAGETLTGRQALAALLLPSANNVAIMLARQVAGSVGAFVAEMNRTARSLSMWNTTYTDPSGYDAGTTSTARDQVLLAEAAMGVPLLRSMVSRASYQLPIAGTVHNTDTLLGTDGFAGIKTGSMDASGGCFMFLSHRSAGDVYGVVLGQHGHNLITAGLYAGKQLADRVSA
jgi:serine-type D-Ala-D-Ala carboxypeptidase (penicillin-binding protein 5/6)